MSITLDRTETRLCINCRHYQHRKPDYRGHEHFCLRGVSLVTGEPEPQPCGTMRYHQNSCGTEGKLFEPHPDKL